MNILDIEIPNTWISGAELNWVASTANETSYGGVRAPVARQTRPLMEITFDVAFDDVVTIENLYILCNGPANGFFARPPIERYYKELAQSLGVFTGSPQAIQLTITRGQTWDARYIDGDTIVVYSNGVPITGSPLPYSINETTGVLTITGTLGETGTIDFEYKTAFQFTEDTLQINLNANYEAPKSITILEIP